MMREPEEWLIVQVKTAHSGGIGDDLWQEFHFYPHYGVKEWQLFADELAKSISDWLTAQRREVSRKALASSEGQEPPLRMVPREDPKVAELLGHTNEYQHLPLNKQMPSSGGEGEREGID